MIKDVIGDHINVTPMDIRRIIVTETLKKSLVSKKALAKQINTSVDIINKHYNRWANRMENSETVDKVHKVMFNSKKGKIL